MLRTAVAIVLCAVFSVHVRGGEWERAEVPREWNWPRDHGAHPEFKTEWWYFTGNLEDADGRPLGYQLTFFRQGIQREPRQTLSRWAVKDFYFAHFTVSDIRGGRFHAFERSDRGALGQSSASETGMNVRLRGWSVEVLADGSFRLRAKQDGVAIDFVAAPKKPPVLQGNRGLSQKADGAGNASHYYSLTRMDTTGTLVLDGREIPVSGLSWCDREFSTSSLGDGQIGWDWFGLQLGSGEEVMLYLLRHRDGTIDRNSSGTWVHPDGATTHLTREDFQVVPTATWTSPRTKGTYPSRWTVRIPKLGVELTVIPRLADQELILHDLGNLAYWEGACTVAGTRDGRPVAGSGYTELTGYAAPLGTGMKE